MFHLPKQVIRPNKKSPIKDFFNHTDGKKRPNINQIKEEIESVLKRNSSPLYLTTDRQIQKSQKYLNHQTLQRKRSKILTKATQQYVQMAKNNRKLYEQFLLGGDIILNKQKSISTIKQNLQTITAKSGSYEKDTRSDFITSKANFNSHRTISHNQKNLKQKSLFHHQELQPLGLGKFLFSTDNQLKFRRTNLMSGKARSQSKSIFKQAADQTFCHGHNFDLSKYIKSERKSSFDLQSKQIKNQEIKQKSFEIVKKQIIQKQVSLHQEHTLKYAQLPKILSKHKYVEFQLQKDKLQKIQNQQNPQPTNKTLNVVDDQLLVYYGKLKNKKYLNLNENENAKNSYLYKIRPKNENLNSKQFTKFLDMGSKTSRQFKKQHQIQSSWKTHGLDPWEKAKLDQDIGQENLFEKGSDKLYSCQIPFSKF